jgi:hypothetical protein
MNFAREFKSDLILEDVWGTPEGWKKRVSRKEFYGINKPGLQEITIYCSIEEFVLSRMSTYPPSIAV